jgi:uncharacterized protein (DUF342 family)
MGGICHIGESMKNLSELIDKHEEIYGDLSQSVTHLSQTQPLPTMADLRMTKEEKRKKQKRDWYDQNKEDVKEQRKESGKQKEWYANNRIRCIEKATNWNKENQGARKLITERYKSKKGNTWQWTSPKRK